jgi:MFS family permease
MVQIVIISVFCAEIFSRALLLAIIPLKVLDRLGTMQGVALFYAAVAVFGLGNSILVPTLLGRLGSRMMLAAAGFLIAFGVLLLGTGTLPGMAVGLTIRVFAQSCVEISMMTYMMARIPRGQLGRFEPIRIFFQGAALAISPWLGFHLKDELAPSSPFLISAAAGGIILSIALIAVPSFRPDLKARFGRSPRERFRRFFSQPRLRLAWWLALVRSSFWVIFYTYAPVFSVVCGWSPSQGAAVLSFGNSSTFLVPLWGKLSRRFGARALLTGGYLLGGLFLLFTAIGALWSPEIAPLLLLAAAFAAAILDGSGNVPFLRATHPHERGAMTGIYMTYRDVSQFAPIAIFSVILSVSHLASAFAITAASFVFAGQLARSIHPRLR